MNTIKNKRRKLKAKRTFMKQGTCSRTFFYILNREFGREMPEEENAVDLMAGGILQQGYQCGMIWGAAMALGAESYHRHKDVKKANAITIKATEQIIKSFEKTSGCIECEDFTKTDFQNKWHFAKYMLSGKFYSCFKLAAKWAPEAIDKAYEGLNDNNDLPEESYSCASEVIKQMGGTEEEQALVAGFAGGLGLSGSGCGALAAGIWMNTLGRVKAGTMKNALKDPIAEKILEEFYKVTDYKMECSKICGKQFKSVEEHSEFVKNGGCKKIIEQLADKSKYIPSA